MKGWTVAALAAALSGSAGVGAAVTPAANARTTAVAQQSPRARAVQVFAGGSRIGISVRDLEEADSKSVKAASGVVIEEVSTDSPAAKAGLRKGDVLVEFDGERVRSARQLTRLVQETPAGRSVTATIVRDGQRTNVTVTPTENSRWSYHDLDDLEDWAREFSHRVVPPRPPAPPSGPRPPSPPAPPAARRFDDLLGRSSRLGVTVDTLSPQLAEYFGTKRGVLVTSVFDDSVAARAGLKAGDVITSLNGSAVDDPSDVRQRIQALKDGEDVTIEVMRERKPLTLKGKVERTERRRSSRTVL